MSRATLDAELRTICPNVYFQGPSKSRMVYPCIMYEMSDHARYNADDIDYLRVKGWRITVIDSNPDSVLPDQVAKLKTARFDRAYSADGLNHWIYTLYHF